MGCSASKPNTLVTKNHHHHRSNDHSPQQNNHASSLSNYTIINALPMMANLSFQAPLVHHPPSRKGDTHHLVSLTSTTYGSLLLIDRSNSRNYPDPVESSTSSQSSPPSSLSPDSVINTWELMDGLDDDDEFDKGNACRSEKLHPPSENKKPLWKHLSEESMLSKMDPIVASSYRRALYQQHQQPTNVDCINNNYSPQNDNHQHRIVIYFTSLRGIRKTYEDCHSVRMILNSFKIGGVDERDISMDSSYKKELQGLLGVEGKAIPLPQVFIRGKHIGGAEEIKHLNETGELRKLLKGFPVIKAVSVCESCGDARFVPCPNCCGSRKVFDEEEDQLRRCPDCNENGLIRCPAC